MQRPSRFQHSSFPIVLTVPGLDGSGPDHWQSRWEALLPDSRRVQMPEWSNPQRSPWIDALDEAAHAVPGRFVFAAHSLGCLAICWWAALGRTAGLDGKVAGALLVAPPAVDEDHSCPRLHAFRPAPSRRLPFPSLLVASRNDPYCEIGHARALAGAWGSNFIDLGEAGHINATSALGDWSLGLALLGDLVAGSPQQSPAPKEWAA